MLTVTAFRFGIRKTFQTSLINPLCFTIWLQQGTREGEEVKAYLLAAWSVLYQRISPDEPRTEAVPLRESFKYLKDYFTEHKSDI